ncbi:hypothetical protein Agub_g13044, partial [Astrephomene gubernaculifera]
MADLEGLFSRIFAVKLYNDAPGPTSQNPPVVVLSALAQELEAEAAAGAARPTLDAALMDRVLVARLIESPPANYPQPPIHYLLGCYERSSEELRKAGANERVKAAVAAARDLILNYTGLALFAGMLPQPPSLETRGSLQLMDALLLRHGLSTVALATAVAPYFASAVQAGAVPYGGANAAASSYASGVVPMPVGFLEELAGRYDNDEGLAEAASKMVVELSRLVSRISPLGDPAPHLTSLAHILSCEPLTRGSVLAAAAGGPAAAQMSRHWLPADVRAAGAGRAVVQPGSCWLGPFFNISPIPDDVQGAPPQEPSVLAQCFAGAEQRRPGDMASASSALRLAMRNITGQLHGCVKSLLKCRTTKSPMLRWLGAVLEANAGRAKLQIQPEALAGEGFLANVAAVLLKLCGPFLADESAFWKRVDPGFVAAAERTATPSSSSGGSTAAPGGGMLEVSYGNETRLAAGREEEAGWRERVLSHAAASGSGSPASPDVDGYHFICQAFFLTAQALHVGPVRGMTYLSEDMGRELRWLQGVVGQFEAAIQESSHPAERAILEGRLQQARGQLDYMQARYQAYLAVLLDPALVGDMLAFYRLMASWLFSLATSGGGAGGAGGAPPPPAASLTLPLPEPAPQAFTCMPEYFLEDMCTGLLFLGRAAPQLLSAAAEGSGVRLERFVEVFTCLMASPGYVRSAFLRSKLSEVLELWLPRGEGEEEAGRGNPFRRSLRAPSSSSSGLSAELAALFNCSPLVVRHLAPVLVQLYNDIEHTERQGAFYFKFSMRVTIANILRYLWQQPQHRAVWLAAVRAEQYRGHGERFANMLLNDLTYLLDETLRLLRLVREAEELKGDEARWGAMPREERDESLRQLELNGNNLRAMIQSATSVIDTLNFITEEVDTTRTLLQPHMVTRLRDSLNYFLAHLVGPERRQLRVRQPEKYGFNARELLRGLVTVYLHVDSLDRAAPGPGGPVFAAAVGADKRSFRAEYFMEALSVLDSSGLLSLSQREQLGSLSQRALAASSAEEAEEEEMGGEVPEEFACGIMSTVMKDPVQLPSGAVVDRPNILRHLLSDPTDPFSRLPLAEEQLTPLPELAARIGEWRRARRG